MPLQGTVTLTTDGSVTVSCMIDSLFFGFYSVKLWALQVGPLH